MAARRTMSDYQQYGFGGLVYFGLSQGQSLPMTYEQRKTLYRCMYSNIVAKIYEDEKLLKIEKVPELIQLAKDLLDQAGRDYRSEYESHSTTSDEENKYVELLALIYENLAGITAKTKLIEKVQQEQEIFA